MIECALRDSICEIRLNRPEKRNALTPQMLAALADTAESLAHTDAHVALVRGEGRSFCAGFDLDLCRGDDGQEVMRGFIAELSRAIVAFRAAPVPVVMAVRGAAVAGGCALLGGADAVIAERSAKFGYPVVRLGISPAVSAPFLRRSVTDGACRARLLDPGLIDAERAHQLGLVHELVADQAELELHAAGVARSIWAKPWGGVRATKAWLNELTDPGDAGPRAAGVSIELTRGEEAAALLARFWERQGS